MIVGVCSVKGAPGVTTLAAALTLAWPGSALLVEADPSGAEAALRWVDPNGDFIADTPSVQDLATRTEGQYLEASRQHGRADATPVDLWSLSQRTRMGFDVLPGSLDAVRWTRMYEAWPAVSGVLRAWDGPVVVDLGRMDPEHAALEVARAADVVLLLAHGDLAGLHAVRERAPLLADLLGSRQHAQRLGVTVRTPPGGIDADVARAIQYRLDPAVVLSGIAEDHHGAAAFTDESFHETGFAAVDVRRSPYLGSVHDLIDRMEKTWPDLRPWMSRPTARRIEPPSTAGRPPKERHSRKGRNAGRNSSPPGVIGGFTLPTRPPAVEDTADEGGRRRWWRPGGSVQ